MAEKLRFEEALARLEEISGQLEAGNLSLEEALTAFEEGISLVRLCNRRLQQAEKKVQRLSKSAMEDVEPRGAEDK